MAYANSSNHTAAILLTDVYFCYEGTSGSCRKLMRPLCIQILLFAAMVTTILLTVLGNLLLIVSIAHFRQLHTPTNALLLSLATCDLLLGVIIMPLSAARSAQGCWYLGDFLCRFHTSIDIMLSTASIFHLACISAERYTAICWPLKYKTLITPSSIALMVASCWLVPSVFAFGLIFSQLNLRGAAGFYESQVRCQGGCHVFFGPGSAVVTSLVCFFIPSLVMIWIYHRIYLAIRSQAKSIRLLANQLRTGRQPRDSRHFGRKGTTTLALVVGVFLFCWSPYFLSNIIAPFIEYRIPSPLTDALVWLGYFNSMLNPFIYAFLYRWFRKALKMILNGQVYRGNTRRTQLYS